MGTRADFYVGRGENAEWIGSIAWNGCPAALPDAIFNPFNEADYQAAVAAFFEGRDDVTLPEQGWPWPWDDSNTTDWAYAFELGSVYCANFGGPWTDAAAEKARAEHEQEQTGPPSTFPNMSERKNNPPIGSVASGIILLGMGPEGMTVLGREEEADDAKKD